MDGESRFCVSARKENLTLRVVAIDWSGAKDGGQAKKKIWRAEIQFGRPIKLRNGHDREEIARLLIEEAEQSADLVIGLDFAFSFPTWFFSEKGLSNADELWGLAAREGETWLQSKSPFWGRRGSCCLREKELFRKTEHELRADRFHPKSAFQIGGPGAVGTGSVRGMPILRCLRNSGFSIWPFDPVRFPLVVEIYPRCLTGRVKKSDSGDRAAWLDRHHPDLDPAARVDAEQSDDAFDALASALAMSEHVDEFRDLSAPKQRDATLEGWIWQPRCPKAETPLQSRHEIEGRWSRC